MGASQSGILDQTNELLEQLGGPSSLSYTDPYWQRLFNSISPNTLLGLSPQLVHTYLQPHCEQLVIHNAVTHNFQVLVLHTVTLLADAIDPVSPRNRKHAANGLHLVWAILQRAGGGGSSMLSSLLQLNPNLPVPQHVATEPGSPQQLLRLLVRRCLLCLVHLDPRGAGAYCVLVEALQLLLVLLATTQLPSSTIANQSQHLTLAAAAPQHSTHVPTHIGIGYSTGRGPPGSHPGLEALCSFQQLAPKVVSSLLRLYIGRPAPPPAAAHLSAATQQRGDAHGRVLSSAASMASSLLWLPVTTVSAVLGAMSGGDKTAGDKEQHQPQTASLSEGTALRPSPVADLAVLLLLLLLHAPDQPINPYKWCIHELTDAGSTDEPTAGDMSASGHAEQLQRHHASAAAAQAGAALTAASMTWTRKQGGNFPGTSSATSSRAGSGKLAPLASADICQHATASYLQLYHALSQALLAPSVLLPHGPHAAGTTADSLVGVSASLVSADNVPPTPSQVHAAVSAGAGLVSSGTEEAVLLTYTLIMGCTQFKEYMLSHPDLPQLLVPLLRCLYHVTPQQQPRLLFMVQILLLIFSQDVQWCQRIHMLQLPHSVGWCKESSVAAGVSLGSLAVVILLRTISTTWSLQTTALVSPANALAALANMAPYCTNLHARAAQRLLTLLHGLTKRYARMGGLESAPLALSASLSGSSVTDNLHASKTAQMSVVEDYLRIVLEIIQLCLTGPVHHISNHSSGALDAAAAELRAGSTSSMQGMSTSVHQQGQLASNLELVYALLQQQDVLIKLQTHPRLGDLAGNIQVIVDFFNRRLDQPAAHDDIVHGGDVLPIKERSRSPQQTGDGTWSSVDQVLSVLSATLPAWRPEQLKSFPQLSFVYEEDQESDTFFVPYAWNLVLARCGSICWQLPAS